MKTHSFESHTPEEMRRLSNLGHLMEGVLLAVVGVLALLSTTGAATWAALAWPLLLLIAGIGLLVMIFPRHPVAEWSLIWRDPQQRQHTWIAIAGILAGLAELVQANTGASVLEYVWPIALFFIGALFMLHTQHGHGHAVHQAVLRHRILGITVMVAGLFKLLEIISRSDMLSLLWPAALLVAAIQLVIYREPEGAFDEGGSH